LNTKQLEVAPQVRGLIFDLDGTLVDSMPLHYEAWKEVCAMGGLDFSEEEFYQLAGVPSDRIFEIINERHGTDFEPKSMSMLKEETYIRKIHRIRPVEAVLEVVRRFHGVLPMSVGTGSPREHSWHTVRSVGLDRYFDILISRDDVTRGKPDPETFLKCAEAMGVNPEVCQVFEDGDLGLQAAAAAGMIPTDIRPYLLRD
jgi:beta-phosphoglucomutase family hydrolase